MINRKNTLMKRLIFIFYILTFSLQVIAQNNFRLHVQPGKNTMEGDGNEQTTLMITARDINGKIMTSVNGTVKVRINAGLLEEPEIPMVKGIASTVLTAPMFSTPIKAAQRMIYFIVRFMQKFLARVSGGSSTSQAAMQKEAGKVAMDIFREGLNPVSLVPKKKGNNFVYIVCEVNGVKGKAKIRINKSEDSPNGSVIPGTYYGKDITGQSSWEMTVHSAGKGYLHELSTRAEDANTIFFSNEDAKEINSAYKAAGMGGFKKAWMGASDKEMKYTPNKDIKSTGMEIAYMPMPKNAVFLLVPPILFDYQKTSTTPVASNIGSANYKPVKADKVELYPLQNELIGDGTDKSKIVFRYINENGKPVSGKSITWECKIPLISAQTVTDQNGEAYAEFQTPVLKGDPDRKGIASDNYYYNYEFFEINVRYSSSKNGNIKIGSGFLVYKTLDTKVRILKPGFDDTKSFNVLLPQLENYTLSGNIFVMLGKVATKGFSEKTPVNDAAFIVEGKKFDEEELKKWKNYSLSWRKGFMYIIEKANGSIGYSDKNGDFSLNVGLKTGKKLSKAPVEIKFSESTGLRADYVVNTLDQFNDITFKSTVIESIYQMEKSLCVENAEIALNYDEKLTLFGMQMAVINNGAALIKDTGGELVGNSWEVLKQVASLGWEYGKVGDLITGKLGEVEKIKKMKEIGVKIDEELWWRYSGKGKGGITLIMKDLLRKCIYKKTDEKQIAGTSTFYKLFPSTASSMIAFSLTNIIDTLADKMSKHNSIPDAVSWALSSIYYYILKKDIQVYLSQDPAKIHAVFIPVRTVMIDRSNELRTYYQSIALWRYNAEMAKGYKDFLSEAVVKGTILGVAVISGNLAAVPEQLELLDKVNKYIDLAFAGYQLAAEFKRLGSLYAECSGDFKFINNYISSGSQPVSFKNNDLLSFPFISKAYAQNPPSSSTFLKPVSENSLALNNGALPVNELNILFENHGRLTRWMQENDINISRLYFSDPATVAGLLEESDSYNHNMLMTLVLTEGIIEKNNESEFTAKWNENAKKLTTNLNNLTSVVNNAVKEISKLPVYDGKIDISSQNKKFDYKKYLPYGVGVAGIIIIAGVVIFFIRRKPKSKTFQKIQKPVRAAPVQPVTVQLKDEPQKVDVIEQTARKEKKSIRFCPHCGNPLKEGAKFCGKCGQKTGN